MSSARDLLFTAAGAMRRIGRLARPVPLAVTLIAVGALHPQAAHAHSQTGSPTACVSSAIGGNGWSFPARAVSSNDSFAQVGVNDNENSDRLQCTDYGFTIPAGATILGIIVNVERKVNNNPAPTQDFQMRVIKGGAVQATDRSTATAYPLVDTIEPHGSATDLWGTTWTPAEINAANFGAAFAAFKNGTAGGNINVTVDHIEIVVHYSQPPPAPTIVSPADASSTTNPQPTLDWTDVTDPDGDTVTYDIQADNSGCGFPSPEVNQTGLAVSTFTPGAPLAVGSYCWRVRAVDEHGIAGAWSTTQTVTITLPVANPSAFDAVHVAAAKNTAIRTRISGTGFSLDVLALDGSGNILAGYLGTVTVAIVDAASGGGVCTSMTSLQNLGSFTFTGAEAGRKTVAFNYANSAPNARIRIVDAGAGVTGCSFDNFAIRPASITVSATDTDWASAGGTRTLNNTNTSASPVHKAGRPFRIAAVAQPVTVTQYTGTPTLGSATCLTLAGMTGCTDGAVTIPGGAWSGAGTRVNDTATYNEAGALTLLLEDATFASVDNADSSAAERVIPQTAAIQVGRFVPDHFVVAPHGAAPAPQFQTFGAACAGARSFTYIGQPFGYITAPRALVTAREAGGGTTVNYRNSLWKISAVAPSDVTQAYSNNAIGPPLDASLALNAPAINALDNGTGTVTISASDLIFYTRDPATPAAQFNANISLTVSVRDDSESEGQITTSTATPFPAIAFDSGNAFRYGRLHVSNANGSQIVPLRVPLETQYWNGTVFVTNAADNCSTLAAANVGLGNFNGLAGGDTSPSLAGAFSSGRNTLTLSAPGAAKSGSVDVVINLNAPAGAFNSCVAFGAPPPSPTGAGRDYLRGRWCGASFDRDATARARFGVYRGAEEVIYVRENF